MTLIRQRREQKALNLSLPPPRPPREFRAHISSTSSSSLSLSSSTGSNSGAIESISDLEKLDVLGHGNGGIVYKVRHKHPTSIYALKVLRSDENATRIQQQANREAEILKLVDSHFVVKCHGVFRNEFMGSDTGSDLCFVMEYMEAGSLIDILRNCPKLPEKVISTMARQVLEGLNYLHGLQIVHRDIKPSNLLINRKGEVKIADFGVSRLVSRTIEESESYVGTYAYMSPERFDPERWNAKCCNGYAGDVWSLGVVVLECLVGHFPLIGPGQKPDWATLMCAICFGEKVVMPENVSPEFQTFVRRCLEKNWRCRGTVEELLSHPFVTNHDNSSMEELVAYSPKVELR